MPTPEKKRERAGQLYVMACDAYARGHVKLAEILVAKGNLC
jgi:hypothetical protein